MLALALLVLAQVPDAGVEDWETSATEPYVVKTRAVPNSDIREVWAEGDLVAPVKDIEDALCDMKRFKSFMPYVKDARELSKEPDGSVFTYTEMDLPVISPRDYAVHVFTDEEPKARGVYRAHWVAAPDALPQHEDFIRLTVNEGSWVVTPKEGGKSHVVYRFRADCGGLVPVWLINLGNRRGVPDVLGAIEKEAQRRYKARSK
jgi:hypothetical protein